MGCLLQQPGRTTWDTKLDLTSDPGGFLDRSLHLWSPMASFGELQNQAYGYLFPQGPFFLLGDVAGVPDWVLQRVWSALLLVVAYEGTRYVARALGIGAGPGVLAGLAYALSPRLLGAVGILSGEVLPSAVLPWAVLPLVLARAGRLTPRQGGLWCGVAVLCMSGVNGAGVIAVLPVLILLALTRLRSQEGRRLAGWWVVGMAAACAWWLVPLLLLGRYSPPFLDFIENTTATTHSTGWSNSVRGTEHWLGYFSLGDQAWWPGAHQIATTPLLIISTGLVAAVGLTGLARRDMPLRGPLLAAAVLGLLCLTAGNATPVGSLVDGTARELLDGALAPLRNVHKVDPLVRLPLALGLGHAVGTLARRMQRVPDLRAWSVLLVVAAVLVGGAPLATDSMRMPGFDRIPSAWQQTADFLDDEPGSRALLLPGSGFGLQTWGWTIDEPMQGVADSAWVTRSQVPLVPGPTARYLDTVERRIASGEGGAGLAAMLARGGVTHVVLRRDLDPFVAETVPSDRAELALVNAPGLTRVAGFGRSGFGDQALIDVYAVADPVPAVSLVSADAVQSLRGAPDDLLTAIEGGVLSPDAPVEISALPDPRGRVVGDQYRSVERQFGRVHDGISAVKGAAEPSITGRRETDYPGVPGIERLTFEVLRGDSPALTVVASSSQGYADEIGAVRPEFGPKSAVDGDPATQWRSAIFTAPDDQWLELRMDEAAPSGGVIGIRFDEVQETRVTRVRVRSWNDAGEQTDVFGVGPTGLLLAPLPGGPVRRVRVEVVEANGSGQVSVSEISLPDGALGTSLVLPQPVTATDHLVMRLDPPRRACVDLGLGPHCQEGQARNAESRGRLDRTFDLDGPGTWSLAGTVVAAGLDSSRLIAPTLSRVRVHADSVLAGDPAVAGAFAFDANPGTSWLTGAGVERAVLRIRWQGELEIGGLSVAGSGGTAVTPGVARIKSGDSTRVVDLDFQTSFEPFVADGHLKIVFERPVRPGTAQQPMGIAEVDIQGLESLPTGIDMTARTGADCGFGPVVEVDGTPHETAVTGTLDDVRLGRPLTWWVCDGPVRLSGGRHRVTVEPTNRFTPVELAWRPATLPAHAPVPPGSDRSLDVREWGSTLRRVEVGAGEAAVLRVAENVNDGWRARLDGRALEPVTLDGWQQGYRIPAGQGGRVTLTYVPDATYRAGLLIGGALALLLVLAAAVGQLWERRRRTEPPPPPSGAVFLTTTSAGWPTRATAGLALLVLGGPVAFLGYVASALPSVRRMAVASGGLLIAGSGLVAALSDGTNAGRPGYLADALTASGVGLLLGSALLPGRVEAHRARAAWSAAAAWHRAVHALARNWVIVAAVGLIVGQAVVRSLVVAGSWWWQDDFIHLDSARRLGLSQDFLVRDYHGHLEPGQYFVVWLVGHIDPGSFVPAAVTLVVLQALASLLLFVVLVQLFGRSPWLLVPFAAYLFTPLGLATGSWFAAGLQAYPLQIALLTALLGLVRFETTGHARWLVLSVAAHVLGLAFWEKAVLILPVLLAIAVLVLSQGLTVRRRWERLWDRRWFWAAQVAVLACYLALYLTVTDSRVVRTDRGLDATLHDLYLRTLLPGLFGGPWSGTGALNTVFPNTTASLQVLFAVLTAVLVAASLVRRGPAACAGWLLCVGYLAADTALLVAGRGDYLGLVARDPRYLTDALPILVIGVCAAFAGPSRSAATRPRSTRSARRPGTLVALLATGAVTVSGLVTTTHMAEAVQHRQSEDYVDNLTSELRLTPGASVLLSPVPFDVTSAELPAVLRAMDRQQALDRPGTSVQLVAPTGRLVAADAVGFDVDVDGPTPDCGWLVGTDPRQLTFLPDPGVGQQLLRLGFVSGGAGVLHLAVGAHEQAVVYPAGLGTLYFMITGQSGHVRAWIEQKSGGVCLTELQRGVPAARP